MRTEPTPTPSPIRPTLPRPSTGTPVPGAVLLQLSRLGSWEARRDAWLCELDRLVEEAERVAEREEGREAA